MPQNNLPEIISPEPAIAIFEHWFSMLEMGGPVMFVLLFMSIFALGILIFKIIQFQVAGIYSFKAINLSLDEWKLGHCDKALDILKNSRNPAARVMETALMGINKKIDPTLIREEVGRIANYYMEILRSYFRAIEVIASLSPLLGLFGTVLGIINAFHELEKAGNNIDPSMLSGGIWVALLTTAAGLAVGMPAVAALSWLESKLDHFIHLTENSVTQVFTYSLVISQNKNTRVSVQKNHPSIQESYAQ